MPNGSVSVRQSVSEKYLAMLCKNACEINFACLCILFVVSLSLGVYKHSVSIRYVFVTRLSVSASSTCSRAVHVLYSCIFPYTDGSIIIKYKFDLMGPGFLPSYLHGGHLWGVTNRRESPRIATNSRESPRIAVGPTAV